MNALVHKRKADRDFPPAGKALMDRVEVEFPEEDGVDGRPVRALLVDGSPAVLKTLNLLLQQHSGLLVIGTAMDGYHAVRRVVELEPDLVLMDLRLPEMNGLEATRQIKSRPHAPAVIMVSADDTPECRAAASVAGTDGFVGKQHMFAQLPAAIRKLFPKTTLLSSVT
jgi:DNA-binding NarL/FixJ family response regulator